MSLVVRNSRKNILSLLERKRESKNREPNTNITHFEVMTFIPIFVLLTVCIAIGIGSIGTIYNAIGNNDSSNSVYDMNMKPLSQTSIPLLGGTRVNDGTHAYSTEETLASLDVRLEELNRVLRVNFKQLEDVYNRLDEKYNQLNEKTDTIHNMLKMK